MKYDQSLFSNPISTLIPEDVEVVFVSDAFPEDYLGGAELTLQALIDTAPVKTHKILASRLSIDHLRQGSSKYWVFGNYATLNPQLLQPIAAGIRYSIVECDYKFCRFRSIEKHFEAEGAPCDCDKAPIGAAVAGFMSAADHVWWMSEEQRRIHLDRFPHLIDYPQDVLSSVFDDAFFDRVARLRSEAKPRSDVWLVLGSQSWIKGTQDAEALAVARGWPYKVVGGLEYPELLRELSEARGVLFLPKGGDTCPRLVIEAKLLGCQLELNANVQHAKEAWFDTDDLQAVEDYLRASPARFWRSTAKHAARDYTVSGYTTTYNCADQEYPFVASIESMLGFCDEVVVVDGGSQDATLTELAVLQEKYALCPIPDEAKSYGFIENSLTAQNPLSRLKVYVVPRDWSDPRSALFDGQQKAEARRRCAGDFCWQFDVDELTRQEDWAKAKELVKGFPKAVPMLALPVVEYWGSLSKVRLDSTPWKWRLSRNSPRITHGVPVNLRSKDAQGRDVASPGTDGCDPIDAATGEPIVFLGFLTQEMEQARQMALRGDAKALTAYETWFERVVANVPSIYHLSWLDFERKIRLYKRFWSRHWQVLNGDDSGDMAENNMFFDKKWADVTDEDIKAKAKELAQTGGHVFHVKYRGQVTPWMTLRNVTVPEEIIDNNQRLLKNNKDINDAEIAKDHWKDIASFVEGSDVAKEIILKEDIAAVRTELEKQNPRKKIELDLSGIIVDHRYPETAEIANDAAAEAFQVNRPFYETVLKSRVDDINKHEENEEQRLAKNLLDDEK